MSPSASRIDAELREYIICVTAGVRQQYCSSSHLLSLLQELVINALKMIDTALSLDGETSLALGADILWTDRQLLMIFTRLIK
jgi:hypothetical protein